MDSLSPLRIFAIRAQGPSMRMDDLSAPSGRFVARVSAAVTTVARRPGLGVILPDADTAFASAFAVPSEDGTDSAEDPAAATAVGLSSYFYFLFMRVLQVLFFRLFLPRFAFFLALFLISPVFPKSNTCTYQVYNKRRCTPGNHFQTLSFLPAP